MGHIQYIHKFGRNVNVDTGAERLVGDDGVTVANYQQAAVATAPVIVSSSVDDAAAGTGARTVRILGLAADWEIQSETITLNGTTEVPLTLDWIRVYRIEVIGVGSGGVNAGVIDVKHATGGNVMARVSAGNGQTLMAIFTVPFDHTAVLQHISASLDDSIAQTCLIKLWSQNSYQGESKHIEYTGDLVVTGSSFIHYHYTVPVVFNEGTDIWVTATPSASDQKVNASFDLKILG